jgi:hypothetical protein
MGTSTSVPMSVLTRPQGQGQGQHDDCYIDVRLRKMSDDMISCATPEDVFQGVLVSTATQGQEDKLLLQWLQQFKLADAQLQSMADSIKKGVYAYQHAPTAPVLTDATAPVLTDAAPETLQAQVVCDDAAVTVTSVSPTCATSNSMFIPAASRHVEKVQVQVAALVSGIASKVLSPSEEDWYASVDVMHPTDRVRVVEMYFLREGFMEEVIAACTAAAVQVKRCLPWVVGKSMCARDCKGESFETKCRCAWFRIQVTVPVENVADASTTALTAFMTSACSIVAYNWMARTVISRADKVTMEMYRVLAAFRLLCMGADVKCTGHYFEWHLYSVSKTDYEERLAVAGIRRASTAKHWCRFTVTSASSLKDAVEEKCFDLRVDGRCVCVAKDPLAHTSSLLIAC